MTLPKELLFPTARCLGWLGPDDDEWHRIRAAGISGTEASVVVGLSRWDSPFSLWHRKAGELGIGPALPRTAETPAMRWGKLMEPVISDYFAQQHPELRVLEAPFYAHVGREWQVASPDRILVHEDGSRSVLEIKTASTDAFWRDGPPVNYRCQVLWYMDVLGLSSATVAVLFGGNTYREYRVEYDAQDAAALREAAAAFHASLQSGDRPPLDGTVSTYDTVREIHGGQDESDVELPEAVARGYARAVEDVAGARRALVAAQAEVLDAIGSGRRAVFGAVTVATRTVRDGKTWSLKPGRDVACLVEVQEDGNGIHG